MKNFLDLLDTDPKIILYADLEPINNPHIVIKLNEKILFENVLEHRLVILENINPGQPIKFSIKLENKDYNASIETALSIKSLNFDDIKIIPNYLHYIEYDNDHDYLEPTTYIGFNGKWSFSIDIPFYRWFHQASNQGWLLTP